MISTEWGQPNAIKTGFNPAHVAAGNAIVFLNVEFIFKWTLRLLAVYLSVWGSKATSTVVHILDPELNFIILQNKNKK